MRNDPRPWLFGSLALVVIYVARDHLAPFVVAGVLAYIFTPTVNALAARLRIRRGFAVGILYLCLIGIFAGLIVAVERPLAQETRALLREGPSILNSLLTQVVGGEEVVLFGQVHRVTDLTSDVGAEASRSLGQPGEAVRLAEGLFRIAIDLVICLIATFYLLLDGRRLGAWLLRFFPPTSRPRLTEIAVEVHVVLGRYLRGVLVLIVLMSIVTYASLMLLFGLRYALPVAVATGFLEIIPYFGPFIAGAIAVGVGFAQGGIGVAVGIAILYFVLRQLEDQLVMPQVVGQAVHIHPLATIFAVVVGEAAAGVLGMLLAIPIAAALKVIIDHVYPSLPNTPNEPNAPAGLANRDAEKG